MPFLPSSRVRADMFAQLAAMEKAGIPASQAWSLLRLPAVAPDRVLAVQQAIERGNNLAGAARKSVLISPIEDQLLRAALEAGSPAAMYRRLAARCAQRSRLESGVRARMVLPVATWVLALILQPLPQWVLGSLSFAGYLVQILKPLLVAVGAIWLVRKVADKLMANRWGLMLPVWGEAVARRNALNFFESLALLLEAGVPMLEALPGAVATVENPLMHKAYAGIKRRMQRGASLSEVLARHMPPRYLGDPRIVDFIVTGESSGTLPEMILRNTQAQAEVLESFWQQVSEWLPRLAYAAVAGWMAYALLNGSNFAEPLESRT